jgi:hypothetical protein
MSITLGDSLKHNNPIFPIADIADIKGGTRTIATFSNTDLYNAFSNIPDKLKQNYTNLIVTNTNQHYYLSGTDATITTSWTLTGSGLSATGTTNSITKWTSSTSLGDSLITDNGDTVTINGNLTVIGTSSIISSQNLLIKDPIILLAGSQSTPLFDSGLFINRGTGDTQAFIWDESATEFKFISTTSSATTLGNVSIGTYSNVRTGSLSVGIGTTSSSRFSVSSINGTLSLVVNEQGDTIFSGDTKISGKTFSNLPPGSITFGGKTAIYSPTSRQIIIGTDMESGYNYNYGWKFTDYQITNLWGNVVEFQNTLGTIGNLWIGSNYIVAGYGLPASQQSTLFVKGTTSSIMKVVGTGATWSNSASIFEINNSGVVSIGSSQSISGSKLFIQSSGTSSTIGSNIMLDLYNGDNNELGTLSEIAFSSQGQAFASSPYNVSHRYAVISGYANTWNNLVTGGGIKFSTRNGTPGSLVTALVVSQNGSVYNASKGTSNTIYGLDVLVSNITGAQNTGIGYTSLNANTYGNANTALGFQSLSSNTTGYYNTALGMQSMINNKSGYHNTAIGGGSQIYGTQCSANTSIGFRSLTNNIADNNTAIGYETLFLNTTGVSNTAIGYDALFYSSTTINSIYIISGGSGYTAINMTFSNIQLSYISGSSALDYPIVTIHINSSGVVDNVVLETNGIGFKDYTTIMGDNLGGTGVTFSVGISYLSSASYNTAIGYNSLRNNREGSSNTAIGYNSLFNNITGHSNTTIGVQSLENNTIGTNNTAIGVQSLQNNTTGSHNNSIGSNTLQNNTTGVNNIGIGTYTLYNNTTGGNNIGIGTYTLYNNTTGGQNIGIGPYILQENMTGDGNIGIGLSSLASGTNSYYNIGIGQQTLYTNRGYYNIAIGFQSLLSNTTAYHNIAVGHESLISNTTGENNTAIGYRSLFSNKIGSSNIAIGHESLLSNLSNQLVAIGVNTLRDNTIGSYNIAIGHESLMYNTTAPNTISIINPGSGYTPGTQSGVQLNYISGSTALSYPIVTIHVSLAGVVDNVILESRGSRFIDDTTIMGVNLGSGVNFYVGIHDLGTGNNNTVIGYQSLYNNTIGYSNVAVGHQTLYYNKTGYYNTAIGDSSLYWNTTGYSNTAVGYQSSYNNKDGGWNVAVGYRSLASSTQSFSNTAIGYKSLENTVVSTNTAVGYFTLNSNTTADSNTAVGYRSLESTTIGNNNTGVGSLTLLSNVTGTYNTAIGFQAGWVTSGPPYVGVTNSNTSVFIGYGTKPQADNQTNQIVIGAGATGSGSNTATLGADTITKTKLRGTINIGSVLQYASNSAAISAGLVPGDIYQTPGNVLMVVV